MPLAAACVAAAITLVGPSCFAATVKPLVQPKRPPSSYMLFVKEMRPAIVKKLGEDARVPEVGKEAGKQWKALKSKAKYEKEADKLKAKYEKDIAAFVKAGGEVQARKPKKKTVKDPNAPKKPLSAYMLWLGDNRARITKSLPKGSRVTEVAKQAGVEWKKVASKAKGPYEKKAEKAKAEYQDAMKKYMAGK